MVKTTNSNIRSSGLDAVVEQLKINNEATLKQTNAINTLLQDNQNARLEEKRTLVAERTLEQRKESLAKKSRLEALRERKPTGIVGSFARGAMGGTAFGALSAGLGGIGIGGGIGALLRGGAGLAGKGLLFGGLITAANAAVQSILDRTFENIKPEDIGFEDEERAKDKITGGINAAIALKFLGLGGRTSLLTGIGFAFSDQITDFISDKLGADKLTAPDWLQKTFGLTEDQMTIDLKDGKVAGIIGAAVSLLAGQIAIMAATRAGRGIKNFIVGAPNNPETLKNKRGFDPKLTKNLKAAALPKGPSLTKNIDNVPNVTSNIDDVIKGGKPTKVGGLSFPGNMFERPKLPSGKFATNSQIQKALVDAAEEMADAKRRILVAEAKYKTTVSKASKLSKALSGAGTLLTNPAIARPLSFGLKAAGPASLVYSGVLGILDEERKAAGQGVAFRTGAGIVEGFTEFGDFILNNTYGLMLKGMNEGLERTPLSFRFKTESDLTGAFRSSSFVLHDAMAQGFADYLSVNEKEINNLTLGGSNLEGGNFIISNDQIRNENNIGTNNFSMMGNNNATGFINPYSVFD